MNAFFLAVAAASLTLTLDPRVPAKTTLLRIPRSSRIELDLTLHHPAGGIEVERPEADFENRDPRYFDHRPGPNVVLRAVRIDGVARGDVPMHVISSGSGGELTTDTQSLDITVPPVDADARMQRMLDCIGAAMPGGLKGVQREGFGAYIKRGIVDNEPGTYELTATYRATAWPRATPSLVSPPLRVVIEDGTDGYRVMCDKMTKRPAP